MEKEKHFNNTNTDSAWDSLMNLDTYKKTDSGIYVADDYEYKKRKYGLGQSEFQNKPSDETEHAMSEAGIGENNVEVEAGNKTEEDNAIENRITEETPSENINQDSADEKEVSYQETAFVQSSEEANKLENNPDYFTYLVSSDHGFAIEKNKAVDACIEKMKNAENNEQIWQAIRLGQDITNGSGKFSDEDKQKIKDFMATPIARKKELSYRIAHDEKSMERLDEGLKRCKEVYNRLNTGNVVDKFFRRGEINSARMQLNDHEQRKNKLLKSIERQRAELQRVEEELGEAA